MTDLADLEITDCHHHLWDLKANYYPWLTDRITHRVCGEYSAIRKDYLIGDFLRDASGLNLVRSVHVQAEHDHRDPIRETRWLQSVADTAGSSGVPHGIVAYVDFLRPDIDSVLDGHCQFRNTRGIRQMLHEALVDPLNPRPSLIEDPVWRRQFQRIRNYPLSFDLQVYYPRMDQAFELVKENPDVSFVLCHMGQPARRDEEGIAGWRSGMRKLAQLPNLCVKLSGIGMFDRAWTVDSLRPFVLDTIDAFSPGRCLFASNFPVDSMACNYSRLWTAYSVITAEFTREERARMFSCNARRVYRV
jgi:predicted TIM-barrel fold metal-dependent hydrolase